MNGCLERIMSIIACWAPVRPRSGRRWTPPAQYSCAGATCTPIARTRNDAFRMLSAARRTLLTLLSLCFLASGCATSVNDLLWKARRGDPAQVKEAIAGIGDLLYQKEQAGIAFTKGDLESVDYLKEIARTNENSTNRARAISSLGRLRSVPLTAVYLQGVEDSFWPVRLEAAAALARQPVVEA